MRYTGFLLLILIQPQIVLSQESTADHKLLIEKHYQQYTEAFSAQDVDLIESFFTYPMVMNGDDAKVIINADTLKATYKTLFEGMPERYKYTTVDTLGVISIGNMRYKAIVKYSHWDMNGQWLGTERGSYYFKDIDKSTAVDFKIHHYTPQ